MNKQLGYHTDRVDRWQNSNQRQRWMATALLEIEPRLKKVKGHKFLSQLRVNMKGFSSKKQNFNEQERDAS